MDTEIQTHQTSNEKEQLDIAEDYLISNPYKSVDYITCNLIRRYRINPRIIQQAIVKYIGANNLTPYHVN